MELRLKEIFGIQINSEYKGIMIFDGKKIITNETELVEVFNNHWINIVEKSSGKKSRHVARDNNIENKRIAIQVIKKYFENHPSIKQIQENFQHQHIPSIPCTTTEEVKELLKEVNAKKASGFDKILPKLVSCRSFSCTIIKNNK